MRGGRVGGDWELGEVSGGRLDTHLVTHLEGAFSTWTVNLWVGEGKTDGFKRVLLAGGAKILATRPPFPRSRHVTHLLVDDKMVNEGRHAARHLAHAMEVPAGTGTDWLG